MPRSIGEAIFLEADMEAHLAYYDEVSRRRNHYLDHRPRIDSGEGLIYLAEDLDEIYDKHCRLYGKPLRKAVIDFDHPNLVITIQNFDGPFPWEES